MGYSLGNYGISTAPQQTVGSSRYADLIKGQLALTAWRHGRTYGGHAASLLIAQVIATRVKKGFGNWFDVIQNIPKFSATLDQPTGFPNAWDRDFLRVLSEIDGVFDGTAKDNTNAALFWADLNNITSEWFLENVARSPNHTRVADMNSLTFWS
jgi:hypothetical protein